MNSLVWYTVHLKIVNSAIFLYCSLALCEHFFFSVLIFLIFFFKKTKPSLEWILYPIIFYLILLHAIKFMETVVLIGCISYVMKL